MKRSSTAILAAVAAGWVSTMPALAAPPTVTPSPGYDARLQEQRAASQAVRETVAPIVTPVPPRHRKKTPTH